ncbi:AAA family ATPase [Nocardia salmonicida]|uniref:AAA family ATPase n=1 Tax=Nocardia salmonicida TaxID=53431 RepID=UPI002E28F92F|nr:AAA family ATPase [Nocardia salmonicida]
MRITSLNVNHFRSINNLAIENFSEFNVLIGKNNSGKSNILTSIDLLFKFLNRQELASKQTTIRSSVDSHNRTDSSPIQISCTLDIGESSIESILTKLSQEYPQIQNTLPQEYSNLNLNIQVDIRRIGDQDVQYISSVSLVDKKSIDVSRTVDAVRVSLLTICETSANEIAEYSMIESRLRLKSKALDKLDENWDQLWETDTPDRRPRMRPISITRYVGRTDAAEEVASYFSMLTKETSSISDLRTKFDAYRLSILEELDSVMDRTLTSPITGYAGDSESIPYYVKHILEIVSSTNVLYLEDRREPIGESEAERLLELKMTRGMDSTLKSIQQTVRTLLGVEIDAFQSQLVSSPRDRLGSRVTTRRLAELDVDNFLVQANGSGVREALRVVLDVAFETPDILLVEEPEVHLHPAFETAMLQHLKTLSSNSQVFLTTHSTSFVDSGELSSIYITRNEKSTSVQHVDISTAGDELPKELGIRLSSIFMFDRLVFVEGQTDEAILRKFAAKLDINLSNANVGFVTMGGSRNFAHYAASSTLSLLTRRRVRSLFVIDRDEQDENRIEKLTKQLGDLGTLHVLSRREIENYLIDPEALAQYLSGRCHGEEVTAHQIQTELHSLADELKDLTIAKRVAALSISTHRPDRTTILRGWESKGLANAVEEALSDTEKSLTEVRNSLSTTIADTSSQIADQWESNKLVRVPGEELLANLFRKHGLRYKKDRDGIGIVQQMNKSRIPEEIVELLRKICS